MGGFPLSDLVDKKKKLQSTGTHSISIVPFPWQLDTWEILPSAISLDKSKLVISRFREFSDGSSLKQKGHYSVTTPAGVRRPSAAAKRAMSTR